MSNEELREKQQEVMDEYKRKLSSNSAVSKWVNQKKMIRLIGVIFLLAYFGIQYLAFQSVKAEINVALLVVKALFGIFWFTFFILPTGPWKASLMFYLSAAYNFADIVNFYMKNGDFSFYFSNGPMLEIYFIMSVLIPILFLLLACWLTIPKKNRELADQAQELNKEYIENVKQLNSKN